MPFWTMQCYHWKLFIVSKVKYPLINFDKPLTRQYHSGGRSIFQGNVIIPGLKKAGYMMVKLIEVSDKPLTNTCYSDFLSIKA